MNLAVGSTGIGIETAKGNNNLF